MVRNADVQSTGRGADTPRPHRNNPDRSLHMSRDNSTPQQQRRRRLALGLGTGAGASLAAAFISMGTASAIPETPDPFTDLGVTGGTTLDTGLTALNPVFAAQLDGYADNVDATDHNAFADLGFTNGAALDAANPTFSAQLDPFTDTLTAGATAGDHDAFADLFGPSGAALDTAMPGLSSALDPAYDAIVSTDADPFTDLMGATSGAPIDTFLDGIPFGTTTVGGFLDPFADAFLAATVAPI
jgi:hypothetical protein